MALTNGHAEFGERAAWLGTGALPARECQRAPGSVTQASHFCGTNCGTTKLTYCFYCTIGGEGGIRTLGELQTHTRFPGVLLKPLGHLSGLGGLNRLGGDPARRSSAPESIVTAAPFQA